MTKWNQFSFQVSYSKLNTVETILNLYKLKDFLNNCFKTFQESWLHWERSLIYQLWLSLWSSLREVWLYFLEWCTLLLCAHTRFQIIKDIFRVDFRSGGIAMTSIQPSFPSTVADRPRWGRIPEDITARLSGLTNPELKKKKREAVFDQLYDSTKDFFCCKTCRRNRSEESYDKRLVFLTDR